jgi:hypothetical protein
MSCGESEPEALAKEHIRRTKGGHTYPAQISACRATNPAIYEN